MLAVMKYEEELREGCDVWGRGASNARETRPASRDASVEKLEIKRLTPARCNWPSRT
jgi:hypothetical protein